MASSVLSPTSATIPLALDSVPLLTASPSGELLTPRSVTLKDRICRTTSYLFTTIGGVKALQKGLAGVRGLHKMAVDNQIFNFDVKSFARGGWGVLDDFSNGCKATFTPLGLASLQELIYDEKTGRCRLLAPKANTSIENLNFTIKLGEIALEVMGGLIWFSQKDVGLRNVTSLEKSIIPLTLGVAIAKVFSESTDLLHNTQPTWWKVVERVMSIALNSFKVFCGTAANLASRIPIVARQGMFVVENFFKFGKKCLGAWQIPEPSPSFAV